MVSLYEPSIRSRSSALSVISRRISKRFTTLEGWREIGLGVYAMGSSNIRMFSPRHQLDLEHDQDKGFDFTQTVGCTEEMGVKAGSLVEYRRSSEGTIGKAIGSVRGVKASSIQKKEEIEQPYHVYTLQEKWTLVAIVGAAGIFPMLTFNIYLPVLRRIATDLETSTEAMNLTITAYLVIQGIAPLFWGPLADHLGRRSVYILTFGLYVISSLVLSFSPSFPVLLVFRGLQAASVASTASIGHAVMQDIALPNERDDFYNFYHLVRNGALLLAPISGGLTLNWADFRSLFVTLFALSLAVLVAIAGFLPETLRTIAGNGSTPLTGMNKPLAWKCKMFEKQAHIGPNSTPTERPALAAKKFLGPFRVLKEKDMLLSLVYSSIIFAIWMKVTVSTTSLFQSAFNLNEAFLGLAFVPNFLGSIAGSTLIGNFLDQDFKNACLLYKRKHFMPSCAIIPRHPLPADFAIEHIRLKRIPALAIVFILVLSPYGYTLAYPEVTSLGGWICIPLLLQFLIAATAHAICGVHQTLISDLWSNDGSGATCMASNLMRCLFSAIGVAIVEIILAWMGSGPAFLAAGIVVMTLVPLPIVQWYWGQSWRAAREEKLENAGSDAATTKV